MWGCTGLMTVRGAVLTALLVGVNLLAWVKLLRTPTEFVSLRHQGNAETVPVLCPLNLSEQWRWKTKAGGSNLVVMTPTGQSILVANISLVIGLISTDFYLLPLVLESISLQTVKPIETIFVINPDPKHRSGEQILHLNKMVFDGLDISSVEWLERLIGKDWLRSDGKDLPDGVIAAVSEALSLDESLKNIPNVRFIFSGSMTTVGANRVLGGKAARAPIVSFFDADDYMHPQRIEIIDKIFKKVPSLEAAIHEYAYFFASNWTAPTNSRLEFTSRRFNVRDDFEFLWDFELIWERLPVKSTLEPNVNKTDWQWWFPINMSLPKRDRLHFSHNGWLSIRKEVLSQVEYPQELSRGQDSLYNWRLIKRRKHFNLIPFALGAYLRPGGIPRRKFFAELEKQHQMSQA